MSKIPLNSLPAGPGVCSNRGSGEGRRLPTRTAEQTRIQPSARTTAGSRIITDNKGRASSPAGILSNKRASPAAGVLTSKRASPQPDNNPISSRQKRGLVAPSSKLSKGGTPAVTVNSVITSGRALNGTVRGGTVRAAGADCARVSGNSRAKMPANKPSSLTHSPDSGTNTGSAADDGDVMSSNVSLGNTVTSSSEGLSVTSSSEGLSGKHGRYQHLQIPGSDTSVSQESLSYACDPGIMMDSGIESAATGDSDTATSGGEAGYDSCKDTNDPGGGLPRDTTPGDGFESYESQPHKDTLARAGGEGFDSDDDTLHHDDYGSNRDASPPPDEIEETRFDSWENPDENGIPHDLTEPGITGDTEGKSSGYTDITGSDPNEGTGFESEDDNNNLHMDTSTSIMSGALSADSGLDTPPGGAPTTMPDAVSARDCPQIYTDWANHYLEKSRQKRYITDLQVDICDGVLLADVINAVTSEKVADINAKPRTSAQMVENVSTCLSFLATLGVNIDGLSAKDIKDGNLKAILGLFFSLSRFKQQQKNLQQQGGQSGRRSSGGHSESTGRSSNSSVTTTGSDHTGRGQHIHQPNANCEMQSRLPGASSKSATASHAGSATRCPTVNYPAKDHQTQGIPNGGIPTSSNLRLAKTHTSYGSAERNRARSAGSLQPGGVSGKAGSGRDQGSSSRSTSPSVGSGIPTPAGRSLSAGGPTPRPQPPTSRLPASTAPGPASATTGTAPRPSSSSRAQATGTAAPGNKNANSMLDKFKFFKDKGDKGKGSSGKSGSKGGGHAGKPEKGNGELGVVHPTPNGQPARAPSGASAPTSLPDGALAPPCATSSPKLAIKGLIGGRKSSSSSKGQKKEPLSCASSSSSLAREELNGRRVGSSSSIPSRAPSSSASVSSSASSLATKKSSSSSRSDRTDTSRSGQGSPGTGKKTSKIASLSGGSSSTSRSSSGGSKSSKSNAATTPNGPCVGIPAPSNGTGIPKPGSRGSKSVKEDANKNRVPSSLSTSAPSGREGRMSGSGGAPQTRSTATTPVSSAGKSILSQTPKVKSPIVCNTMPKPSKSNSHLAEIEICPDRIAHLDRPDGSRTMSSSDKMRSSQPNGSGLQVPKTTKYASMQKMGVSASLTQGGMRPSNQVAGQAISAPSQGPSRSSSNNALSGQSLKKMPKSESKPKPQKVDSDTQTQASAVRHAKIIHARPPGQGMVAPSPIHSSSKPQNSMKVQDPQIRALHGMSSKEHSTGSLNSDSTNVSSGGDSNSTSNSTSNSANNSASSTDSVIYRPSSCDELESGMESDCSAPRSPKIPPNHHGNQSPSPRPPLDHISSLRMQNNRAANNQSPAGSTGSNNSRKIETTFDGEVRTEEREVKKQESRETVIGEEAASGDTFDVDSIKPMQPLMRSTQYNYLRSLNNSPLMRPSLHMPSLSSQNQGLAHSASSRLGVNRPLIDPSKLYTHNMKRATSNYGGSTMELDYESDAGGFDCSAGYMSDGDVLRSNHPDDINSGYMSEGGASLYAKRMQQRFREGMMAVKECMQKSSGINGGDDDSFDDSSSISSGDISDTINEISTDENLTGSSLSGTSSDHNPYGSLKRVPVGKDGQPITPHGGNLTTRSLPSRSNNLLHPGLPGKHPQSILSRNQLAKNGADPSAPNFNWRKYAIGGGEEPVELPQAAAPPNWCLKEKGLGYPGGMPPGNVVKKKTSQATITDLRARGPPGGTGFAIEDPQFGDSRHHPQQPPQGKQKKDSETNTEHSMMVRKAGQGGKGAAYGYAPRKASTASTTSGGSSSKGGSRSGAQTPDLTAMKGERLSNYKGVSPMKSVGSTQTGHVSTDMGPEAYGANTLERKKRANLVSSKTQTTLSVSAQSSPEDPYNSLGRRKLTADSMRERMFGSRGSLSSHSSGKPQEGMINSTIISNPHATYQRDRNGEVSPTSSSYLSPDFPPGSGRPLSGICSPTNGSNTSWMKTGMHAGLSGTESMESISSTASSIQAQIQQAKALSLASRSILQRDGQNPAAAVGPIHRSDSFKSTTSDKMFNSSQSDILPRTSSFSQLSPDDPAVIAAAAMMGGSRGGASSPSHSQCSSRFAYPLSALTPNSSGGGMPRGSQSTASNSPYSTMIVPLAKFCASKDDDLHGSSLSLVSSSSSMHSTSEDRYNSEAHVVAAFEQSLSNMTNRLQHLTSTAEQKDSELNELRNTIEALKKQSGIHLTGDILRRQSSGNPPGTPEPGRMTRHMSSESMSSINSMSSACSATSQQSSLTDSEKKKKKKNWLRNSISKAFSRKKGGKNGSFSDVEGDVTSIRSDCSVPNSPLLTVPHHMSSAPSSPLKGSHSSGILCDGKDDSVLDLQQQLHEKDMKLTDIRLEALSSAHQLDQLRDTMNRMKNEMASLKADNDRLQTMVTRGSLSPSSPIPSRDSFEKRLSLDDPSSLDLLLSDNPGREGKRITVSVYLNLVSDISKLAEKKSVEVNIGAIRVSGKTKWETLDSTITKVFKEHLLRLDPVTNMGFSSDSVFSYHVGDQITRIKGEEGAKMPELLPCGYLVGDSTNISICLRGTQQSSVDALAFETLIPKSIVQRYVSLLQEHRRIILCGPSGTGKTYLAQCLAEYLVLRSGKEVTAGMIATFNVDHKSSKELRQYLANIADQCEGNSNSTGGGELPNVIILDNLHHVGSLGEVFNGFLNVKYQESPYIIGTMNQATCSTTNLQLHHNFRWVLCANHMEPVKGFLNRYLRRKLIEDEVNLGVRRPDLAKVVDWVPKVWQHLNKFLETHSSSDVTIGPRLFLSCPMEVEGSKVWFTDLWNYSIMPYMLEAVREGIQLYGRRAPWEDPADWVIQTCPWIGKGESDLSSLLRLRPEDVGYDAQGTVQPPANAKPGAQGAQQSDAEDPLLNMLMRLQEAASYSSPQSNDSDTTSLDSHSSAGGLTDSANSSGVESTL